MDYQRLGPFTIVKQINTLAFQLKFPDSMKVHPVFHVSLLEPYHAYTIPRITHEPPSPIVIDGEQEYEIKETLNSRISHCQLQYLVHWQGYEINESLGTGQKLIKCHGKNERLSHVVFKQAQGHSLWDSLLKGEVMSWTPPSLLTRIIAYTNIVTCIIACIIIHY